MKAVLIRANSNSQIGAGHLMRCIALGQYLQKQNVKVVLLTEIEHPFLIRYLRNQKFETHFLDFSNQNWEKENKKISTNWKKEGFDWIVLDDYRFNDDMYRLVSETGSYLMILQDGPPYTKHANLILNHSISAEEMRMDHSDLKYLFGTKYALIRQELIRYQKSKRKGQKNILVTLGVGSFQPELNKIKNALDRVIEIQFAIKIVSGFNPQPKTLACGGRHEVEYCKASPNMQYLYDWADLSISAAGGTCWELCFFGLTGIIGIISDNQIPIARKLDEAGIFRSIGWYRDVKEEAIAEEVKKIALNPAESNERRLKARQLVDGEGPRRVYEEMLNVEGKG